MIKKQENTNWTNTQNTCPALFLESSFIINYVPRKRTKKFPATTDITNTLVNKLGTNYSTTKA